MSSSSSDSDSDSGSDSDNSEDTYVTVDSSANKTKTSTPNRQMNKAQAFIHKANISAGKIQTMCKLHMGRKRLRAMCSAAWEMVMDNESGDYFYRKMATGEIRWDKPSFYEAPEGSITDKTNQSASELLKLANERLLHLRNNRPKVESTDWPIVLPSGNRYEGQIRQCKSSFFFSFFNSSTSDHVGSIGFDRDRRSSALHPKRFQQSTPPALLNHACFRSMFTLVLPPFFLQSAKKNPTGRA